MECLLDQLRDTTGKFIQIQDIRDLLAHFTDQV